MKKVLSVFLVVVMIVTALPLTTFNLSASAASNGYYTYEVDNGEATITDVSTSIRGNITIPSTLGGYPVTSIGDYALEDCSSLTSVTIPNSVTSIGDGAFSYCSSLTAINVGIGNQSYSSKDGVLFNKNKTELICCPGGKSGEYVIPNSVTGIGYRAFSYCSSLNSVTIPDNVTGIGEGAFYGCSSLASVTIGDSVTGIGNYAFYGCSSLTSITIPDSVTSIGGRAFYYCNSLNSVTIPDSVTGIGEGAFYGCSSLTSVTIPDSVTSIGVVAFSDCSSLTAINVGSGNQSYFSDDGILFDKNKTELICCPGGKSGEYVIPNSVTGIGDGAFFYCSSLTAVTIPDSVTSIGLSAFSDCSSLTSVTIPDNVTGIGEGAFYGCSSLASVKIGDSVTGIGNYAFYDCSSLTSVTIGDSVTSIGYEAFYRCSSLTSVTIPDRVLNIGDYAFSGCSSLTSVTIGDSVLNIGDSALRYCNSLTEINVGSGNQSYSSKDGVLFNKNKTELICCPEDKSGEYVIPDSVTSIGEDAFFYCSSLTSITIPDSVLDIGKWAFSECYSLTSVIIPDSVLNIGDYAFSGCDSLTSITIPDSVLNIGKWAFSECYDLTIYGYSGSVAETYAKENEIKFVSLGCSHKNTTVHPAKASTCKVQGNNKYTTCNDCGKVISGSDAKLPLAVHKYTTKITKATLTKNGSVVKKCSVCGKVASTTKIYYPKTVSIAATTYTYTGKVITPAVTVKNSKGTALKKGTDYTVTYGTGRKNVGKYKVTVTFKGNYSGTKTFYFTINPVKTTVSKLTAGKKSIKVAITKKSTQVTGYQIQYSTSKTFKSAKTVTLKSYKTTSVNLTKLSAKKTYYVRVRTYKTVGKTKYYSGWSTYKKVTTKK